MNDAAYYIINAKKISQAKKMYAFAQRDLMEYNMNERKFILKKGFAFVSPMQFYDLDKGMLLLFSKSILKEDVTVSIINFYMVFTREIEEFMDSAAEVYVRKQSGRYLAKLIVDKNYAKMDELRLKGKEEGHKEQDKLFLDFMNRGRDIYWDTKVIKLTTTKKSTGISISYKKTLADSLAINLGQKRFGSMLNDQVIVNKVFVTGSQKILRTGKLTKQLSEALRTHDFT